MKDIAGARNIIDNVMKNDVNARRKWSLWLEYFDIEKWVRLQSFIELYVTVYLN